jgi:hypothetical protein
VRLRPPALCALNAPIANDVEPKPSRPETVRDILNGALRLIRDGNAAIPRNLAKPPW